MKEKWFLALMFPVLSQSNTSEMEAHSEASHSRHSGLKANRNRKDNQILHSSTTAFEGTHPMT
jgi:hypothetical protein